MANKNIILPFTSEEWLDIFRRRIGSNRKKLSAHFDSVLSLKLQEQENIKCWFQSK
jgi:hypothetical protein